MRRRARFALPDTLCRHIGLLFGERLDTLFTSSDSKISGFTRPHVIRIVADLFFFHSGDRIYFFSGFAVEFAGCVWTVAVSGKKMLRIRKYPDTCGQGLISKSLKYIRLSRNNFDAPLLHVSAVSLNKKKLRAKIDFYVYNFIIYWLLH